MSKRQLLIILGLWIMGLLYLGFRESVDKIILLVSGFAVICVAYSIRPGQSTTHTTSDEKPYVDTLDNK